MIRRLARIVAVLALLYTQITHGLRRGKAIATYYTGTIGAGGVSLNKYPSKYVYVHKIRKSVRLYPVAVYSTRVKNLKYRVVRLKKGKRKIFGHVVDECADGDCHKNKYIATKSNAVLFDLHKKAWNAMRFKTPTIERGLTYVVVGKISRHNASIKNLLTDDGRKGYVPEKWS